MSIYQCPNCGMTRSGNQAMGLAMPQCQCAWQFSPPVTPQRTWVGLTEAEIKTSLPYSVTRDKGCFHAGALWAEAKLKEKNT